MTTSLPQAAATAIRAAMAQRGVSQDALAEKLGRSQTYVWRRLTGEVNFDLAEVEQIAGLLDVPVAQFVGGDAASTGRRTS
jgi:transcriptional regulator with XRE-family HTH domain